MKYTKAQQEAVTKQTTGNILVSASAGSGKTRVLVDRVLHWILANPEHDLRHLLIVTFTRAAAKEMRDRLQQRLQQHLIYTKDPQMASHLVQQLRALPVANISTLDAFCQRVITHYYYVIGCDPHFRVLTDATEVGMLRDQVWQDLREDLYAHDKKFMNLVQHVAGSRPDSDDQLTDLVYQIYDYANVKADPQKWLNHLPDLYQAQKPLVKSVFYRKHLLPLLQNQFTQVRLNFAQAQRMAKRAQLTKETQRLTVDLQTIDNWRQLLKTAEWDQLRANFTHPKFGTFPSDKKHEDDQQLVVHKQVMQVRNQGKKALKKVVERFFTLNEAQNLKLMQKSAALIQELVQVVRKFSQAYQELESQRHTFEFIDLEHAALRILRDQTAEGKSVRHALQHHFHEIMVDEYQDNNHLQDAILTTIAKPGKAKPTTATNMFMVGDVKQSIYRFRLADPQMFLDKQNNYQKAQNANHLIRLAENFRSTANIDAFVNLIFDQIMDQRVGQIDYYPHQELKFGAKYYQQQAPKLNQVPVQMLIYDSSSSEDQTAANPAFPIDNSAQGQIEIIAQKIQQLMEKHVLIYDRDTGQKRPLRYSDIALISATRNNDLIISDCFQTHHLPVTINGAQSYFKTAEIQIMMALLKVIDNPEQDIPFVAVLRSPMVGLNENQLAFLRITDQTSGYYETVRNFVHHYGEANYLHGKTSTYGLKLQKKLGAFFQELNEFRDVVQQHGLVALIWDIYQKTGFLDYVGGMPAGKQRQANLHALYERAAEYEKSSFQGLFQFVHFIQRMQDQDQDLAEADAHADQNTISVMTIHGSKGLEFPVVFFYDVSHNFNVRDLRRNYVLNDQGMGLNYYDFQQYITYPTLPKQVITEEEQQQTLAEEMRKMYVALTRAEQRLYIVGATKQHYDMQHTIQTWQKNASVQGRLLSVSSRLSAKNYLDWLGAAVYRHPDFKMNDASAEAVICQNPVKFKVSFINRKQLAGQQAMPKVLHGKQWLGTFHQQVQTRQDVPEAKRIQQIMSFKYPYQIATQHPAYESVSALKKMFEDPDNLEMAKLTEHPSSADSPMNDLQMAVPKFMQNATKPAATAVGTATHLVFQMLDLHQQPTLTRINKEIQKLVKNRLIEPQVAQRINQKSIVAFYQSSLGKKILEQPDHYHREAPFSLLLKANQIIKKLPLQAPDQILVHGIIDGYLTYVHQGIREIDLIDYKTDYVNFQKIDQSIKKIKERYQGQLNLYAMALNRILKQPVTAKYLYLVSLHKFVQMD